jgi:hypothetical protein
LKRRGPQTNGNWKGGYGAPTVRALAQCHEAADRDQWHPLAEDWPFTLMAAAGQPGITAKLLNGYDAHGKTFKVRLDSYDQRDLLSGGDYNRREFFLPHRNGTYSASRANGVVYFGAGPWHFQITRRQP